MTESITNSITKSITKSKSITESIIEPLTESESATSAPASSSADRKTLAYETLKRQILTGKLLPGMPVSEKALAEQLHISRTPVHEAVQELVREKLLNVMPRRGTLVSPVSLEDIRQLYELRRILEPQLLILSLPNLNRTELLASRDYYRRCASTPGIESSESDHDADFHLFLSGGCGNSYAMKILKQLMEQTLRIRSLSNIWDESRYLHACEEHIAIADALLDGDLEGACKAMNLHLNNSEEGYRRMLSETRTKEEEVKWLWQ